MVGTYCLQVYRYQIITITIEIEIIIIIFSKKKKTGEGNPYKLATIHSYESKTEMSFWNDTQCNKVHGSDGASFNPYIWLSLICSLLIGLLITAIKHFRKGKRHLLTDEQLSLFWTKNDDYVTGNVFDELPNFEKADIIKGYFIGISIC